MRGSRKRIAASVRSPCAYSASISSLRRRLEPRRAPDVAAGRGDAQLVRDDLHRRREVERRVVGVRGNRRDDAAARELGVRESRHLGAEHERDIAVRARARSPRAPPRAPAARGRRTRAAAPKARSPATRPRAPRRASRRRARRRARSSRRTRARRPRDRESAAARRARAARAPSSASRAPQRRCCRDGWARRGRCGCAQSAASRAHRRDGAGASVSAAGSGYNGSVVRAMSRSRRSAAQREPT